MKTAEWLAFFRAHADLRVVPFAVLEVLTGLPPPRLRVELSRLVRRGLLPRLCRGFYLNPFFPASLEEASSLIVRPSYVSLESALAFHGILPQLPTVLTCVTTALPRTLRTSLGVIRYRHISRDRFFGFERQGGYDLALPEKALADCLHYLPREEYGRFLDGLDLSGISRRRLREFCGRMGVPCPGGAHSGPEG